MMLLRPHKSSVHGEKAEGDFVPRKNTFATISTHLEVNSSPAADRYALMREAGAETHGGLMYIVMRKYTKVPSVADAARRAKSGIGQILRESHGFRSYYVLDGGEGVGVAVMIFEDRESATAANDKVLEFVQASLLDLNLGDPEIIAGEVLVNIEI
jgi:hypothetical protein